MNTDDRSATRDSEDVLGKIEKALQHVYDICQGKEKWTMRVPADPSRDSDLLICDALQAARSALSHGALPKEVLDVLRLLYAYGMIHTVQNVAYPDGTHTEALSRAERILHSDAVANVGQTNATPGELAGTVKLRSRTLTEDSAAEQSGEKTGNEGAKCPIGRTPDAQQAKAREGQMGRKPASPALHAVTQSSIAAQVAGRPRGAYEPLTVAEIDIQRIRLEALAISPTELRQFRVLCDMAVNCLLYGEEINRLRHDLSRSMANHNADLNAAESAIGERKESK